MADFNKVGLLVVRNDSFLVCRKNNYTSKLIMPGGQLEEGESFEECLNREVREELGDIALSDVIYIGTYEDAAASDDPSVHKTVQIRLYQSNLIGVPVPSSEIIEILWFDKSFSKNELSSIILNKILPDILNRGILNWDESFLH
jgi:8-oxo-dGTP pyrophosphatase MutT (NUDIX family)